MQSCQQQPKSLPMETESSTLHHQEKAGLSKAEAAWGYFKALPGESKARLIKVGNSIRKIGEDDPRKVTHSLKVGLALTLVSMLYYARPLYDGFKIAGIWAVITVVVVFEFTVGGTLSKGLNRGFATLLAGALGVGAQHFASLFGEHGKPIVLGILVFLLATAATFTRFIPRIKARYDYGLLIFILTFSMVSVSGYRVQEILVMAQQRLSTVIIGGVVCMVVSICICPVWAGEDLHYLVASNIDKLAFFLEGFEGEFFQSSKEGGNVKVCNTDKSFLQKYKSVLNSKPSEESMANLARWEPRHGPFGYRHPWNQYLKIGALSRQCAYLIEPLNGYISSGIQVPQVFQSKIQEPCTKMSQECGMALKVLASAIRSITDPSPAYVHVENSKAAVKDLKLALKAASVLELEDLLAIVPAATVASTLIRIVKTVEELSHSVHELANQANFKSVEPTGSPEKPQLLHCGCVKPVNLDGKHGDHVTITIHDTSTDSPENENPQAIKPRQHLEV